MNLIRLGSDQQGADAIGILCVSCCDQSDYIPPRRYALFQARLALKELGEALTSHED